VTSPAQENVHSLSNPFFVSSRNKIPFPIVSVQINNKKTSLVLFLFFFVGGRGCLLWQWRPSSSPDIASQGNNNQITFFLLCLCVCVIEYFRIQKEVLQERRTRMAGSGPANIISSAASSFIVCILRTAKYNNVCCVILPTGLRCVYLCLKVIFFFLLDSFLKATPNSIEMRQTEAPRNLRKIKSYNDEMKWRLYC